MPAGAGNAVPDHDVEAGDGPRDRRRVGQLPHRPLRGAGERADLAFPDLAERGRERDDRGVGLVAQERGEHLRPRAIDDVDLVDPGLAVEIGHEQMRPVARARGRIVELTRLLLRRRHELGQRGVGQARADQHHRRQVCHVDDRRKRSVRIVGQRGREHVRHCVRPDLGEEQRIAVRLLARDGGGGERPARAGPILHDQRLPVGELRKAVRQIAGERVGRAAGADRDQQPHRPVGPLRRRLAEGRDGRPCGKRDDGDGDDPRCAEWHDGLPHCCSRRQTETMLRQSIVFAMP
jgi:hypothetical protein